jgi:hypothetical protein
MVVAVAASSKEHDINSFLFLCCGKAQRWDGGRGCDFWKETLYDDLEVGRETRERTMAYEGENYMLNLSQIQSVFLFFILNYVVPARLRQYMG